MKALCIYCDAEVCWHISNTDKCCIHHEAAKSSNPPWPPVLREKTEPENEFGTVSP